MEILSKRSAEFKDMQKGFPKTIYKYRDWNDNYHKTVLTQKELYYSPPDSFEDPKDCKSIVRFDLLNLRERIKWIEYKLKQQKPGKNRQFYRQESRKLYGSAPISDNDRIKEIQEITFREYNQRMGVLSLTGNNNIEKMWVKYANEKQGFCVGFDPLILFEHLGGGGKVYYEDVLPIVYPEPKHSLDVQMFIQVFFKERKWEFEEEYRTYTFSDKQMERSDRIIKVPSEAYKELILGERMKIEDKKDIIESLPIDLQNIKVIER